MADCGIDSRNLARKYRVGDVSLADVIDIADFGPFKAPDEISNRRCGVRNEFSKSWSEIFAQQFLSFSETNRAWFLHF